MKLTEAIKLVAAGFNPLDAKASREVVVAIQDASREDLGRAVQELLGEQLAEAIAGLESMKAMDRARAGGPPPA